jgi:hypothetical protein
MKCPLGAGRLSVLGKEAYLVVDAWGTNMARPQDSNNRLRKRERAEVVAVRFNHEANYGARLEIKHPQRESSTR